MRAVALLFVMLMPVAGLVAQTFDVASVKESSDAVNSGGGMRLLPSGDIRVQHMRARFLIHRASGRILSVV